MDVGYFALGILRLSFNKNGAKILSKTTVKSTSQLGSMLLPTWLHFGGAWGAKLEPSWLQMASKIDLPRDPKNDDILDRSWDRFLKDFGPQPGRQRGPTNQLFATCFALGALLGPRWPQDPAEISISYWFR